MKYRTLGLTNLRVSVIGLGTWQYGGEWGKPFTQDQVTPIFRRAFDRGVNLVDTAECYGDHLSEQLIGIALKQLGPNAREKFILATKFGHHFSAPFTRTEPRTGPDVQKQLEDSLRSLQTDYIDLYQYHSWGDAQFAASDVQAVLEKAKIAGKIRHIGNSLSNSATTTQTEKSQPHHVQCLQILYNRLTRTPEETHFPIAQRLNLGILARVPLASGLLSGKYKPGAQFQPNDIRGTWKPGDLETRLAEVEKITPEIPPGIPMAQWALAWCLKHPAVQCVIPGCKSVQQLEDNAAAADLPMVDPNHPWATK